MPRKKKRRANSTKKKDQEKKVRQQGEASDASVQLTAALLKSKINPTKAIKKAESRRAEVTSILQDGRSLYIRPLKTAPEFTTL